MQEEKLENYSEDLVIKELSKLGCSSITGIHFNILGGRCDDPNVDDVHNCYWKDLNKSILKV